MRRLMGIGVSPGLVAGRAVILIQRAQVLRYQVQAARVERKPPSPSQPGQLALCWWLEVEGLPFGSPHSLRNEWRCVWLEADPQPQTHRAAAVDSFLRKC